MGTRALIHIKDTDTTTTIATIYHHMDGYPDYLGNRIKDLLSGSISNGVQPGAFNGMGCAAASLVKGLKDGPGGVYLYPPDTCECGEEFVYTILPRGNREAAELDLEIRSGPVTMFGGGGDKPENLDVIYSGPLAALDTDKLRPDDE